MSRAMQLSVPLKVDVKVGHNWGDMETDGNALIFLPRSRRGLIRRCRFSD